MEGKKCLYLCMGSACHQLGVYEVLPKIQKLLKHHKIDASVELKGAFCLGPCANGIVLKYQNRLFTQIRPHNVEEKFVTEILPCLTAEEGDAADAPTC